MARISNHNVTPILEAAEQWKNTCLTSEGSVFGDEPVWTDELLAEFNENFVQQPDFGKDDFYTKLEKQVRTGSARLAKLVAEILWLYYLFPANVSHKTKVEQICSVYGWSGEKLDPRHPMLEALQTGVGSAGMGYNLRRPEEVEYLFNVVTEFRTLGAERQRALLESPWNFSNWLDSTSEQIDDPTRIFRHILVFLLFPDEMERIASKNHKVKILKRWEGLAKDAKIEDEDSKLVALDKRLLAIRRQLEKDADGEELDFYFDPWVSQWNPQAKENSRTSSTREDRSNYGSLHPLMLRFRSIMPGFEDFNHPGQKFKEEELDYKHELLEAFQAERPEIEAKLEKGEVIAAIDDFKRLIVPAKLVNWRGWDLAFGNPINENGSLELLRALQELSQGEYSEGKLGPVFQVAAEHELKPGWTLLTVLLWLWNPEEYYPIKSSYVRDFAIQFGRKLKTASPSSERLDEFMQLGYDTREMLAPWEPRDWIDVQSFMWVIASHKDAAAQLAPPFDSLFTSLEEASFLLDMVEQGLVGLGVDAAGESDQRIAMTLPPYSGRTGTLRVNFGSWVAMSLLRHKDGARYFQFACRDDLTPEGALDADIESSTFEDKQGHKYPVIRLPINACADGEISEALIESMKGLAKHFSGWKGSPYRQYHLPRLYDLFFDEQRREALLKTGFDPNKEIYEDEDQTGETIELVEPSPKPYKRSDALKDLFIDELAYDRMATLLRRKKNLILQGPPGVGKSFLAKRLAYSIMGEKDPKRVVMIQFHQSYAYEDFIQGFRPSGGKGASFEKRNGVFYRFCKRAEGNPDQEYYFIIDEINRGNLSRIFGELMLLIEPDKRGPEHALPLTYTPEERFFVPENVHLIGMMNTADRSLAMVDYALRRRFAFMDLEPAFGGEGFTRHLAGNGLSSGLIEQIVAGMTDLNRLIAEDKRDLGKGYCIGHSYFCQPLNGADEAVWLREIVETEIRPLLSEYWAEESSDKVEDAVAKLLSSATRSQSKTSTTSSATPGISWRKVNSFRSGRTNAPLCRISLRKSW